MLSVSWGRLLFREEDESNCDELVWPAWAKGSSSELSVLTDLRNFTSPVALDLPAISYWTDLGLTASFLEDGTFLFSILVPIDFDDDLATLDVIMQVELPATGYVDPSLRVAGDGLPSLETLRRFFVIEERCDEAKSEVVVISALWGANKRPSPPSLSKTAEGDGKRSSGLEDMESRTRM